MPTQRRVVGYKIQTLHNRHFQVLFLIILPRLTQPQIQMKQDSYILYA